MSFIKCSTVVLVLLSGLSSPAFAIRVPSEHKDWMAAIGEMSQEGENNYYCSGALIDKEWVITAAHCFDNRLFQPVKVAIGVDDLSLPHTPVAVDQVLLHNDYLRNRIATLGGKINTFDNDIALLHLTTPVSQHPLGIDPVNEENWDLDRSDFIAFGYGALNRVSFLTGDPNEAGLPFRRLNLSTALKYLGNIDSFYQDTTQSHLFFSPKNRYHDSGVCQGDDGGPILRHPDFGITSDDYLLVGIASYGEYDCQQNKVDKPFGYTSVLKLSEWLQKQQQGITITSQLGIKVPDDSYGWRDFKVVNRSGNAAELSDVTATAPELDNQCPRTLAAGAECTIRVRFDGKYAVGTVRSEHLTLNSTIAGATTQLEAYLIATTIQAEPVAPSQPVQPPSVEPVPQPEQPISQPAPQPAAASSGGNGGGGGGAFGLAGLLLLPLAWLRRRV